MKRKSYKTMSVAELLKERTELNSKLQEIDEILMQAAKVVNNVTSIKNNSMSYNNYFTNNAFKESDNVINSEPTMSMEPPVLSNAVDPANHMSAFSVFDAETYARQQYVAEEESVTEELELSEDLINEEITSLKSQLSAQLS